MKKQRLHKGTIVGLFTERGSGIALLGIEDDRRGKVLIPCDGNPTCRAFDAAFGGVIVGGRFNNDGITGEPIYYCLDEHGSLEAFIPCGDATPEMVEEYEKVEKGGTTVRGYVPKDHPIFSRGPIITGRNISRPPKRRFHENN